MPSFKTSALSALAGAASVMAHGHVNYFMDGPERFPGFDVTSDSYKTPLPSVYGWSATNTDNGFVGPEAYTSGDIVCHRGAKNAALTAKVAAGDTLQIFWDTWPESHKGPIIDMLAPCGADCSTVDKSTLEFFKISAIGKKDDSLQNGRWASDDLIKNNNTWTLKIPSDVKAGNYVLRHEIIALHSAGQANGAQNYPQCFNLEITGSGTKQPAGTLATKLYTPTDPGILVSIYGDLTYQMPGPANEFSTDASEPVASAPAASATAPAATAPASTAPAATAPAATTTAAPAATTTAAAEAEATSTSAAAPQPTKATCAEKRRRRLARRMARQHARDVVRAN